MAGGAPKLRRAAGQSPPDLERLAAGAEAQARLARATLELEAVDKAAARLRSMGDYPTARRTRQRRGWTPRSLAADAQLDLRTLEALRADSQRAMRSMPLARALVRCLADLTVGRGPRLQCKTADREWNAAAERYFRQWSRRHADARGLLTFEQMTRAVEMQVRIDGDVGAVKVAGGKRTTWDVGSLQLIEGARIGGLLQRGGGQNVAGSGVAGPVSGVELDAAGRPVAYWVAAYDRTGAVNESTQRRIEAADFLFVGNWTRPSATRGEPALTAIIPELEKLHGYIQAITVASEVAACQSLYVKKNNPAAAQTGMLGDTQTRADGRSERWEEMQAGRVWYLEPDEELGQIKPEQPATTMPDYVRMLVRLIAVDLGLPLEAALLDFSQSTAYAGRTGFELVDRALQPRRELLENRWLRPTAEWVLGLAMLAGELPYREDWAEMQWQWPAKLVFEPEREVAAALAAINGNLATKRSVIEARGDDADEVFEQRAQERRRERELGITPVEAPGTKGDGAGAEPDDDAEGGVADGDAKNQAGAGGEPNAGGAAKRPAAASDGAGGFLVGDKTLAHELVKDVSEKQIPADSAKAVLVTMLGLDDGEAGRIIDPATGFTAASAQPAPAQTA